MRSNGLTAAAYAPVADLDPQIAEALLADLKAHGVAAYAKPVESTSTSGFDRPEFRLAVKERLYVDAAESTRVRELIEERDPTLLEGNDDLTWAQLVAGYDRPLDRDHVPWPVVEDLGPGEAHVDERDLPTVSPENMPDPEQPPTRWRRRSDYADTADDDFLISTSTSRESDLDDRFIPETPPPLPTLAPYKKLAWAGLIGGPLILLISTLVWFDLPALVLGLAVIGFVGGFVTLVATMGDDSDGGWGDSGAVV